MGVLPKDYDVPNAESGYMKLIGPENRFRMLSEPIIGNEYWTEMDGERKPVRKRLNETIMIGDLGFDKWGNPERVKHFWAFIVWNYQVKKIQILEITQRSILLALSALDRSKDWGDLRNYDIVVTRKGELLETQYSVRPSPKKPLHPKIKELYNDVKIELEALYRGDDPFAGNVAPEEGDIDPLVEMAVSTSDNDLEKVVVDKSENGLAFVKEAKERAKEKITQADVDHFYDLPF